MYYWNTGRRCVHNSELGREDHGKFHEGNKARLNYEEMFIHSINIYQCEKKGGYDTCRHGVHLSALDNVRFLNTWN